MGQRMSTSMNSGSLWKARRRLYPLYSAMAREFVLEASPCPELDEQEAPSAECLSAAEKWLGELDGRIQVHHLRQFAQTSADMTEGALRDFLVHHLNKNLRNQSDRDKVDFLLVQLFSQCAPASSDDSDPNIESVAIALKPVIGPAEIEASELLTSLDALLQEADHAKSLNAMFTARIIERGREIKSACGEAFFEPPTLAAFTRFGFLVRRKFFRLMQQDLNTIFDGLRELETRGIETLDCRKAQFAADEPIGRLRMICQSWRVMFHAEYSSGQPLCIVVDLRTAVEAALAQSSGGATKYKAKAVAASFSGSDAASEFEVSAGAPDGESEAQS